MNWKSFVEAKNARIYVLPPGWDSNESIAGQLECSVDRVRVILAPAIKAGDIEQGIFPVWDAVTKRVNRVAAYRKSPPSGAAVKPANPKAKTAQKLQ